MNKKLMLIIGVIIIAAILLLGYNQFLAPKSVTGEKNVTIYVMIESEGIKTSYDYQTDAEFLSELIQEHSGELQAVIEDSDYGPLLMGLEGYTSDFTKEYFAIFVNGDYGEFGIGDQVVNDGDIFIFELSTF